jgi:hypothetical protein
MAGAPQALKIILIKNNGIIVRTQFFLVIAKQISKTVD